MFSPRHPLGTHRTPKGHRFALFAPVERRVQLALFEPGQERPFSEHVFDPGQIDESGVLEVELHGLPGSFEYLWRVGEGPWLLDPYAALVSGGEAWGRSDDLRGPGVGRRHRALVVEDRFDWQGIGRPPAPTGRVIYELHVRGFTRHASSGVSHPGTYAGVIEKIPELVELGVTTVELMPVFEFDETENSRRDPATGRRLLNFWGYSPISFFAPKAGSASDPGPGAAARELRTLVRELHRAGLEVILDVVYNHTAEGAGGDGDPLLSWRGFADEVYYLGDPATGEPLDVTGCGNTVNVNHPVVRRLILDSLRHWSRDYRVDGFRFDLAAVFCRGEHGEILERPPLVEEIAADPELSGRLLIAEPWDAAGFTPPVGFPSPWLQWDGETRDGLRRFVGRMEPGAPAIAGRLTGARPARGSVPAERCVRYVACHDGRPLADVVAWAAKHNEANGEGNRDGWDGEVAWNGGVEGPTDDPTILARREREVRLLLALLACVPGQLMLTAGDERGRTQRGNTNAWCQDNEIGWLDWGEGGDPVRGDAGTLRELVRNL
ncbi:MAG TPA: glycogen debranching enzyme, partial [Thermoanaerobaculia bacterium]|nr:glycogen debranching enzyme [Thermoanaerobaculia bacterium]